MARMVDVPIKIEVEHVHRCLTDEQAALFAATNVLNPGYHITTEYLEVYEVFLEALRRKKSDEQS